MNSRSPLATLPKTGQRRKLQRDTHRYLKAGGKISTLDSTARARPLSPAVVNEITHQLGIRREL